MAPRPASRSGVTTPSRRSRGGTASGSRICSSIPKQRGHGVGKALLANLAQRCVREGLGRFEWNVLDWNQPSIEFYKSQGAVFLDEWRRCRVTGEALEKLGAGGMSVAGGHDCGGWPTTASSGHGTPIPWRLPSRLRPLQAHDHGQAR